MFSSALKLADVNDFLAPAQECIKPLLDESKDEVKGTVELDLTKTDLQSMQIEDFNQIKMKGPSRTAVISLNDCLACSGCITSAETVLVTQQSLTEFRKATVAATRQHKLVVVSLSPQSIASLAQHFDIPEFTAARRVVHFFLRFGADLVCDTAVGGDASVLEMQHEFVQRVHAKQTGPMLTSECPGWVCYLEKTEGTLLPLLASCKSGQQVTGALLKTFLARQHDLTAADVFHAAIMPCFDKKLEAARDEFSSNGVRDVDCVLSTAEVLQLLDTEKADLKTEPAAQLQPGLWRCTDTSLSRVAGEGHSGSYADAVLKFAVQHFFGRTLDKVKWTQGRNADVWEAAVEGTLQDGTPTVLRFGRLYGFRNIHNLVRKIKRRKCAYDFVEVMACPSGCLNGGGQIKPPLESKSVAAQRAFVQQVVQLHQQRAPTSAEQGPAVQTIYKSWLHSHPGTNTEAVRRALHTTFVDRKPKTEASLNW